MYMETTDDFRAVMRRVEELLEKNVSIPRETQAAFAQTLRVLYSPNELRDMNRQAMQALHDADARYARIASISYIVVNLLKDVANAVLACVTGKRYQQSVAGATEDFCKCWRYHTTLLLILQQTLEGAPTLTPSSPDSEVS